MTDYAVFLRRWNAGQNQVLTASLVSDLDTPVSAMLKLGDGRPYAFLLESIEGGAIRGRYSIIGRDPDIVWRCTSGGAVVINRNALTNPDAFVPVARAPLDDLKTLLAESRIDDPDQPQPMAAGLFGYLGYDMVRYMETLPDAQPAGVDVPESIMVRPTLLAIFDQIENKFTLSTPVWFDKNASPQAAYDAAMTRLDAALADLRKPLPLEPAAPALPQADDAVACNLTESAYIDMVERAKEYIRAGDIFQVVLARRFSRPFALPPFSLYRVLRRLDPSPFLFFFNFGAFSVVGSSPEILVRVRDGKVTIRPIAGTRPRGAGNQTDQELEAELLADPKELAEHLMLLDLGRNDVGRVAKMGTVNVTARNFIEYYKHVMHIVSNVEGELDPKYDAIDALIGGFPAGTLSGAPKIRAMEIIAELEPDRRGVYGGCIGYFGANGSMDTAIAIRTGVVKDGTLYVQAGGGVVYDSDPQAEYRECAAKARSMLRAAEIAVAYAKEK
ncbi:MAG: anthranilate synthase component I [Alphaproteobacteria bacterium]|nr:anthranilate synthase component I [Alphaproteobacteria bacterium]